MGEPLRTQAIADCILALWTRRWHLSRNACHGQATNGQLRDSGCCRGAGPPPDWSDLRATGWPRPEPRGAPHLTAVWGVWVGGRLVFSTGRTTRKARNLAARADCSLSTEGAKEAVVVGGVAEEVRDEPFAEMANAAFVAKYGSTMLAEDSPVFAVRPRFVNGIVDSTPRYSRPAGASSAPERIGFDLVGSEPVQAGCG